MPVSPRDAPSWTTAPRCSANWSPPAKAGCTTCRHTHDFEANLDHYRRSGVEVVFTGLMKGAPVGWLDSVGTLGFMTELITTNPLKEQIFARFRQAAETWDGVDPIRPLG